MNVALVLGSVLWTTCVLVGTFGLIRKVRRQAIELWAIERDHRLAADAYARDLEDELFKVRAICAAAPRESTESAVRRLKTRGGAASKVLS